MKKSSSNPKINRSSREIPEAARAADLQASHQPVVEACARAATRSVLALRQVIAVRTKLSGTLSEMATRISKTGDRIVQGLFVPSSDQFDLSEKVFDLSLSIGTAARSTLSLFTAQVRDLNDSYERARSASPIAAFRALREVSGLILADSSKETCSAWRYVLLAWKLSNPQAVRIALLQPGSVGKGEVGFKFDELSGEWKSEGRDFSAKVAFAVAK
jgi:hypothetical protein